MVASLQEINAILAYEVDNTVLLRQTTRPGSESKILQRLRLSDPIEWIVHNRLDQIEGSNCNSTICLHPMT